MHILPVLQSLALQIQEDYKKSWELTRRWNMVAVITDGTAVFVLGLGDIGPGSRYACYGG